MFRTLLYALRRGFLSTGEGLGSGIGSTHMKSITTLDELEACFDASDERPVFIFKHSTACPISAEAYRNVAAYAAQEDGAGPEVYLVKVIEDRPVSNRIAEVLNIPHKSPQLILVNRREGTWSASHYGINPGKIQAAAAGKA